MEEESKTLLEHASRV
jgi:hypothetical protein